LIDNVCLCLETKRHQNN